MGFVQLPLNVEPLLISQSAVCGPFCTTRSISFLFEITAAVYLQTTAIIGCSLEIFHDNHRLEQFSAKRMGGKLGTVGYAEHVAGKSNNKKIEFRCLYQPLANVRVP